MDAYHFGTDDNFDFGFVNRNQLTVQTAGKYI